MANHHATEALRQIQRRQTRCNLSLAQASDQLLAESDDDVDSESPIFDSFFRSGDAAGICTMINFTPPEFHRIYDSIHEHVVDKLNVGRGRKSVYKPRNVLFIIFTFSKHCESWGFLSKMFYIPASSFQNLILGFVKIISPECFKLWVEDVVLEWDMDTLQKSNQRFKTFNYAIEAVEVTFQECEKPFGTLRAAKVYWSEKHHLYGYKFEVAVCPNGLASWASLHKPASVSDISILYDNEHHLKAIVYKGILNEIEDNGLHQEKYPSHWAMIADKGYQGAQRDMRVITPYKRPPRGVLTPQQELFNANLSADRIIVENFLGRMGNLCNIVSSTLK